MERVRGGGRERARKIATERTERFLMFSLIIPHPGPEFFTINPFKNVQFLLLWIAVCTTSYAQ